MERSTSSKGLMCLRRSPGVSKLATIEVSELDTIEGRTFVRFNDLGYTLRRRDATKFRDNGVGSCEVKDFDF